MTKQDKIKKVMDEFKRGTLKTPDGKVVKNRKQALAIAMSESEDYAEKGDLINYISVNSTDEALDILKAAGTEDLFEKAKHQDGDMHPNGKWVWVASANGGKGDWRTAGGRAHSKSQAGGSDGTTSDSGKTTTTSGSSIAPKQSKTQKAKPTKFVDTSKIVSKIPNREFKSITHILEKIDPNSSHAESHLEDMTDKELNNFWACADHFKTDYQHINQSTRERCAKWKELASAEMSSRKKTKTSSKKKQPKSTTSDTTKQKKLRPVGTGTNGPERRRKETKKSLTMEGVKEDDLKDCKPGSVIKTKCSGNQTPITYTKSSSGKWDYYDGYYDMKDDLTDYEVARHIRSMSDKKLYPGYSTDFSGLK